MWKNAKNRRLFKKGSPVHTHREHSKDRHGPNSPSLRNLFFFSERLTMNVIWHNHSHFGDKGPRNKMRKLEFSDRFQIWEEIGF
jgi:hypothetical protein